MKRGVRHSLSLLIFLSGRRETDGEADKAGEYEGPFTRWYCHEEMATARKHGLTIVGVKEEDVRFGKPDFELERQRGMMGGKVGADGVCGPVHLQAPENLELLNKVCFISRRTQQHEIKGYIAEVIRQGVELPLASTRGANEGIDDEEEEEAARLTLTVSQMVTLDRSQQAWAGKLWLPQGKTAHFCICSADPLSTHNAVGNVNPAQVLCQQLTQVGCHVEYLQASAKGMTPDTLAKVVKRSTCLLLYLGGGRQQQRDDGSSSYAGVFASDFCHQQIRLAQMAELPVIGVMAEGFCAFAEEKASCVDVERNSNHLALLDTVCFIQARTQAHEVHGFLEEVLSQWSKLSQHQLRDT
jgi:hypothetical protein